jgi:hypothetical protein
MQKITALIAIGVLASGGFALTASSGGEPVSAGTSPVQPDQPKICKSVVSAEPGAKPYQMCMTRAEWEAKKIADAKDPNRMVCQYIEESGTRFRSAKVCMTAMEWQRQRTADREAIDQIQRQSCVPGGGC